MVLKRRFKIIKQRVILADGSEIFMKSINFKKIVKYL